MCFRAQSAKSLLWRITYGQSSPHRFARCKCVYVCICMCVFVLVCMCGVGLSLTSLCFPPDFPSSVGQVKGSSISLKRFIFACYFRSSFSGHSVKHWPWKHHMLRDVLRRIYKIPLKSSRTGVHATSSVRRYNNIPLPLKPARIGVEALKLNDLKTGKDHCGTSDSSQ